MKRSEWIRDNVATIYVGIPVTNPNRTLFALNKAEAIADALVGRGYLEKDDD